MQGQLSRWDPFNGFLSLRKLLWIGHARIPLFSLVSLAAPKSLGFPIQSQSLASKGSSFPVLLLEPLTTLGLACWESRLLGISLGSCSRLHPKSEQNALRLFVAIRGDARKTERSPSQLSYARRSRASHHGDGFERTCPDRRPGEGRPCEFGSKVRPELRGAVGGQESGRTQEESRPRRSQSNGQG